MPILPPRLAPSQGRAGTPAGIDARWTPVRNGGGSGASPTGAMFQARRQRLRLAPHGVAQRRTTAIRALVGLLVVTVGLTTAACGTSGSLRGHASGSVASFPPGGSAAGYGVAPTAYPLRFVDDAGHTVIIPRRPRRIVSLTLGTDEILLGLGQRSHLVGVTNLAANPTTSFVAPEAKGIPAVVGSASQVVALKPDLVFAADYTAPGVIKQLTDAHIPVVEFTTFSSLANIEQHIGVIGRIIDAPGAAARMVAAMQREVASVKRAVAGLPRPRVIFYTGGYIAGSGTTIGEVISDAGGTNAAAAAGIKGWVKTGRSEIVKLDPAVILTSAVNGKQDIAQGAAARQVQHNPALSKVLAVRQHQVWDLSTRANSDVSQYMAWDIQDVASILHTKHVKPYVP